MGRPPLPRWQHMDMQHIIIDSFPLCWQFERPGNVLIVPLRYGDRITRTNYYNVA